MSVVNLCLVSCPFVVSRAKSITEGYQISKCHSEVASTQLCNLKQNIQSQTFLFSGRQLVTLGFSQSMQDSSIVAAVCACLFIECR